MMRTAVIDSSALINLTHLELASKLLFYFDRIYVPRQVQVEVNRRQRFRHRLNKLYQTGVFRRCACANAVNVQLLTFELDEGEAEGLVQAQEKEAEFFIADESRARSISERRGLTPVGTVRLLARLCLEGHAENARALVLKLRRDLNFRVRNDVVESAIASAGAPIGEGSEF
jgi:predicted nucleic acid-binding protein